MNAGRGGYMGDPEITGEHEVDLGLQRRRLGEPFLKGPILLGDLAQIAKLPGKALALWLLIRYRSDVSGEARITLPRRLLLDWGIRKDAKAAALKRLEQAGVIKVERPKGYMLKVKLTYGH